MSQWIVAQFRGCYVLSMLCKSDDDGKCLVPYTLGNNGERGFSLWTKYAISCSPGHIYQQSTHWTHIFGQALSVVYILVYVCVYYAIETHLFGKSNNTDRILPKLQNSKLVILLSILSLPFFTDICILNSRISLDFSVRLFFFQVKASSASHLLL